MIILSKLYVFTVHRLVDRKGMSVHMAKVQVVLKKGKWLLGGMG